MGAAGARAQKPVGSAAWISTEKENFTQLVDQEMEEIEFPVQFEMEWLNEHMAEVFSSTSEFNFAEAFKTPGKMRGKTPRTLRKRDATENRVPLSEIFSSIKKNPAENKFSLSPAVQRSPTKAVTAPSAGTPSAQAKSKAPAEPQYPDLTQNINSFSQYNTDSGYHGMEDDEGDDDELVLTQVAPESQLSTQPIESQPVADEGRRSSIGRRTTDASFHSAHEERLRGETVEPMNVDSPKQTRKEPAPVPEPEKEAQPTEDAVMEDKPGEVLEPEEPEPEEPEEPELVPEKETDAPAKDVESPAKPVAQPPSPKEITEPTKDEKPDNEEYQKQETQEEPEKDGMALDNLDDVASESDDSPERPPVRKSSLSFASLPAREPLGSKTLGGSRLSRTSHLGTIKPTPGPSYSGRQTGHRMTQAQDENTQADKMDVDEAKTNEESDVDSKATKLHSKSSTQRLHEKISMLGKMQPSRPTKSIPAAAASAQVSYPELPAAQPEARKESNSKQRETTPQPPADDEDWIKPFSSPFQAMPTTQPTASKLARPATSHAPESSSPLKSTTHELTRIHTTQASDISRQKSATPIFSSPQRFGHTKSASVNIDSKMTTTPIGSPRGDGPLSASKSRLQSIVRSAKGLFTSSGGISAAARVEASSPDEPRAQLQRANTDMARTSQRPLSVFSPPRQEGRRTRSSTEREERRRQQEIDDRKREEELAEKSRQEEKLRMQKTRERAHTESEARSALPSSPLRGPPSKSREPEPAEPPKSIPAPQANKPGRPPKPTREPQQKPKPQPVSIRVGSALSRQMPLSSMASSAESSIPTPAPPSATKAPSLKKKASTQSLHTNPSTSSFKSSASSQTQRKTQLASERKREQEEREARRKEEQRREMERKRAGQQSRAEAERQRQAEDPKKAAQMQAIEKRRLENARRLERQGSQQPEVPTYAEKPQPKRESVQPPQPARPVSRIGSVLGRTINPPAPNPAKPPKRGLDDEASRPTAAKSGAMQPSGETKRRRTDDEQQQQQNRTSMRPAMAPPIRQSNIRKEPAKKPSMYGSQHAAPQPGSSIFKTAQPQRPGHPMDMAKYASGKIPFAESSNAGPSQPHRTPGTSSKAPKKSPNYPNGENINLPEIATDSEDEDSEAEMLPVPNWAQPKQLETLLRDQEGMEVDSIFGPIAPFSLEETFKADKKIKKFRERTSSANWAGPDGLTQEEIRKDVAERQRLRLNGGWTFGM